MSTIFWLPSSGSAAVSPTPSATDWDGHINTVSRPMNLTNGGSALTTLAYNPDAADHLTDVASLCAQFVSAILPPQSIASQVICFGARCLEAAASNNLYPAWKLYAVNTTGTSVLATLVSIFKSATAEMATALTGYCEGRTSVLATLNVPFRLVLEVGADGLPVNTATDNHNQSWVFGEAFAAGALNLPQQADTTACPAMLVFSNDLITVFGDLVN